MNFLRSCASILVRGCTNQTITSPLLRIGHFIPDLELVRDKTTLSRLHRCGPYRSDNSLPNPLGKGVPFAKGVVLKTLVKKPKKPNSANRKCVLVRLSIGKDMIAHVPGEGHNLQEHSVVLVRPGRTKDVPGLKLKCIRGKYDLGHVIKPVQ